MAFSHGKDFKVQLGTTGAPAVLGDVSPYLNSCSFPREKETAETTAFGNASKTRIAGLLDGSFSLEGFFDPTAIRHSRPADEGRNTRAALEHRGLSIAQRGIAGCRNIFLTDVFLNHAAVIGGEHNDGVFPEAVLLKPVHDLSHFVIRGRNDFCV